MATTLRTGAERLPPGDATRIAPGNAFEPFPKEEIEGSIPERFARMVSRHGDRLAVKTPETTLTYRQLGEAASRVAGGISERSGPGAEPVVLFLPTGPDLLSSMLGVLESGKFYIPIDPALGDGRNSVLLRNAESRLLVTDRAHAELAHRVAPPGMELLEVETLRSAAPGKPGIAISPDDVAYVLFTSGSTGEPKGVVQCHRNVLHNVLKLTNGLHVGPEDRQTLLYSCSFGASVSDLFGALLNGAALLPFDFRNLGPRRLAAWLAAERLTIYHSVPGVFRQLASVLDGTEPLSLRVVKLGGEPVLSSDLELHRRHFPPGCLFHVGLGTTEMNVIRQWFADHETRISGPVAPIGWEVDETEVVLLDDEGRPAAGDTGEIAVVARTLPLGYWKRPDLTEAAFRAVPGRPGFRLYRTGDLGRLLPDGCLVHLGRKDLMVKIRGYRVEPAEIEAALAAIPGIVETAVVAQATSRGHRLVAWVVQRQPGHPGARAIRRSLAERLPNWMVPELFCFVDALPHTPTGKVERTSLPDPGQDRPSLETAFVPPQGDLERCVATIFAEILGLTEVGAKDDFFELGGDSLTAIELSAEIERRTGKALSLTSLARASTVETVARMLLEEVSSRPPCLVPLQPLGSKPPFFCVSWAEGEVVPYASLAARLGPERPVYGLRRDRLEDGTPRYVRVEDMAAQYLGEIRAFQPSGPYHLGGLSLGGSIAFEMARQLVAAGQEVGALILMEPAFVPAYRRPDGSDSRVPFGPIRLLVEKASLQWAKWKLLTPAQRGAAVRRRAVRLLRTLREVSNPFRRRGSRARRAAALASRERLSMEERIHVEPYAPQAYSGPATLFLAGHRRFHGDSLALWRSLLPAGLQIRVIPGFHEKIIWEPFVRVLAPLVEQALSGMPLDG